MSSAKWVLQVSMVIKPARYEFTLEPLSIMAWLIAATAGKTTPNRARTTTSSSSPSPSLKKSKL